MRLMIALLIASCTALSGCISHAPVQIGKDTYLEVVQGCEMFAPRLSTAIRNANESCAALGQVATILNTQTDIQLTCVVQVQYRCSDTLEQGSGPLVAQVDPEVVLPAGIVIGIGGWWDAGVWHAGEYAGGYTYRGQHFTGRLDRRFVRGPAVRPSVRPVMPRIR